MENTLIIPPHERLKLLREGEKVLCKKCKKGVLIPSGDYKTTNTFFCESCGNQLIINQIPSVELAAGIFMPVQEGDLFDCSRSKQRKNNIGWSCRLCGAGKILIEHFIKRKGNSYVKRTKRRKDFTFTQRSKRTAWYFV